MKQGKINDHFDCCIGIVSGDLLDGILMKNAVKISRTEENFK